MVNQQQQGQESCSLVSCVDESLRGGGGGRAVRTGVMQLPYYRKLTMHVDNMKKIYVTLN